MTSAAEAARARRRDARQPRSRQQQRPSSRARGPQRQARQQRGGGRRPPRRPRRRLRRWLLLLAALVLVVLLGGAAGLTLLTHHYDENVARIPGVFAGLDHRPPPGAEGSQNFLLVGSDTEAKVQTTGTRGKANAASPIGQRTDTMMIVHLPKDRESATVISIPRDSWVSIPGYGEAKINAAFSYGGPNLLVRTIEQVTDVRIDHYAQIDFNGFKAMTDAVGGVDIKLPEALHDPHTGARFHAGVNHLTGEHALEFVRQRHGLPNGDFGRMQHQHMFIEALAAKATSKGMLTDPTKLDRLLDAVTASVSVDSQLSGKDLASLALSLRNLRPSDVQYVTVPTDGLGRERGQSVVYLDRSEDAKLFRAVRQDKGRILGTYDDSGA